MADIISRPWEQIKAELMASPDFVSEFEAMRPEYEKIMRSIESTTCGDIGADQRPRQ